MFKWLMSSDSSFGYFVHLACYLKQWSGTEVINLLSCSSQLSINFFLLINVKMPTIVGILTFMSEKNLSLIKAKLLDSFILMSI